ncbi:hypothetical protein BV898_00997 [Hypsibius exemplaris]|uniref:Large ribosomal subunit protein mL53 n=1 Tax=Hypsibius exemplaris TaxID=2072580 RepID=A0A1W0XCV3_HYPEX|nr:hypothetical protein BV898_00997 [Hypsibius exemplaris]
MRLTLTLMRKPFLHFGYNRAVSKVLRFLSLKPIKAVEFQLDPFTGNVKSIREAMRYLQGVKILRTNPTIEFRAKVVDDRSEPSLRAKFADGKQYLIKTTNLSGLEVMEQMDRLVQMREPRTAEQIRPARVRGK